MQMDRIKLDFALNVYLYLKEDSNFRLDKKIIIIKKKKNIKFKTLATYTNPLELSLLSTSLCLHFYISISMPFFLSPSIYSDLTLTKESFIR